MPEENDQQASENISISTPSKPDLEALKSGWITEERARVLSLFEITDDVKDLKAYIEKALDPSQAALDMLKQIKAKPKVTVDLNASLPNATLSGGSITKAQGALNLAKRYGV